MVHFPVSVASRTERGRETALLFVDTALRLLGEQGLDALTIQRLAGELGLAVGTLYRHFPGKGALLAAMQGRVVAGLEEELAQADAALAQDGSAPAEECPRALASLLVAAGVYERLATRRPEQFGLLSMTLGDPRELVRLEEGGPIIPRLAEVARSMANRFRAAAACGALAEGDDERRALVMWASLHGVLQMRKLERFGVPDTGTLAAELVEGLLAGWGAGIEDREAARRLARRALEENEG